MCENSTLEKQLPKRKCEFFRYDEIVSIHHIVCTRVNHQYSLLMKIFATKFKIQFEQNNSIFEITTQNRSPIKGRYNFVEIISSNTHFSLLLFRKL